MMKSFLREEEGVTAIEYGLIAALLALAIVGGVSAAGVSLNALFTTVKTCLDTPTVPNCTP
jgi:pilus assembly protein Flp/PilA